MKEKIKPADIYERIISSIEIGARHNQLYVNAGRNWKSILPNDFAILIRKLYREDEQSNISVAAIKEASERLVQTPLLQLDFVEEREEKYLNLLNGIFDVEAKKLIKNSKLNFGYHLDFNYLQQSKRKYPYFDEYVMSVFPDQTAEKKKLLLEILGYVISDYQKAKAGFFLIGESNSGKSTILNLVKKILPEQLVTTIPLYRLENRFNLARLADSRINICSELTEKSFTATDIFKMLTSNETVTAEHKGCKPFEFKLRCKSLNAGNCIPDIKEDDGVSAIVNRMIILLFPISISKENQDLELADKLWNERDSIFSAAVDALVELRKRNFCFTEPSDSKKLKNQLMEKGKVVDRFLEEWCVKEREAREHLAVLYEAFRYFAEENLLEANCSKNKFSQHLSRLPYVQHGKFRINGSRPLAGVIGIRLKSRAEYESQDSQMYSDKTVANENSWNAGTLEQEVID